jgi:periplasmic divalent cation tolerance protein
VTLPRHLKAVGAFAFNDCKSILSLTLGDELEDFDESALNGWNKEQRVVVSKRFSPLLKFKIDQKINEKTLLQHEGGQSLSEFVMIKTTFESVEEAAKMARLLVNNRYIASAQLDQLNVFYTWNDESCNENEVELSCITRGSLYNIVEAFIKQHHSYECCQIICLPIINESKEFKDWIVEQTID